MRRSMCSRHGRSGRCNIVPWSPQVWQIYREALLGISAMIAYGYGLRMSLQTFL